jgi:hypothetical protein
MDEVMGLEGAPCRCDRPLYFGHETYCERWMDGDEVLLRLAEHAIMVLASAATGRALTPWQAERCAQAGEVMKYLRYPKDPAPPCLDGFMSRARAASPRARKEPTK